MIKFGHLIYLKLSVNKQQITYKTCIKLNLTSYFLQVSSNSTQLGVQ